MRDNPHLNLQQSAPPAADAGSDQQAGAILERVKAYEVAHNAYDLEAVMDLFAVNTAVKWVDYGTFSDRASIQALHAYDKGIRAQLKIGNCTADQLQVTCAVLEENDWLSAAGLGTIFYPAVIISFTHSGKIEKIEMTLSPQDDAKLQRVMGEFGPWLMAERPAAAQKLLGPDRQFIYSEANGRLVVNQLQQWRALTD